MGHNVLESQDRMTRPWFEGPRSKSASSSSRGACGTHWDASAKPSLQTPRRLHTHRHPLSSNTGPILHQSHSYRPAWPTVRRSISPGPCSGRPKQEATLHNKYSFPSIVSASQTLWLVSSLRCLLSRSWHRPRSWREAFLPVSLVFYALKLECARCA